MTGGAWGLQRHYAAEAERRVRHELAELAAALDTEPSLLQWAHQFRVVDRHPEITDKLLWSAANPGLIRWLRSSRGEAMLTIDQFYAGALAGSDAPYPCVSWSGRQIQVNRRKAKICEVIVGWE